MHKNYNLKSKHLLAILFKNIRVIDNKSTNPDVGINTSNGVIPVTENELAVLVALAKENGQVTSIKCIHEIVCLLRPKTTKNAVVVYEYIKRLRKKLGNNSIKTFHQKGYKLEYIA